MATAISSARLDPFSQIQQFYSSLGSFVTSLVESTDSAFRRVQVIKKDTDGSIKIYERRETVIDSDTGESKVITRKFSILTYIEDIETGDLYLEEGPREEAGRFTLDKAKIIVAVKCALIALALPFYTYGKMCWHIVRTPVEVVGIALRAISQFSLALIRFQFCEAGHALGQGFIHASLQLGTGLFEIIKSPLFALGCEIAAIYGIFKPFHARKMIAKIENAWQQGISYKEDFRRQLSHSSGNQLTAFVQDMQVVGKDCWNAFVSDIQTVHPYYLAQCFQVRGNVNDPRITVLRREDLSGAAV